MKKTGKRLFSLLLSLVMVLGLIPAMPMTAVKANGSGDTWSDPILISTMDELFAELSKETSSEKVTYYRLAKDLSVDTHVPRTAGLIGEMWPYTTAMKNKGGVECKVAAGKKNLELVGHDIHYKQNVNAGGELSFNDGIDSLTLFMLLSGADLTISNTSRDEGRIWYDGWMNDRSGWFSGPNYTYTASRDVFRVEEGAELTLNNTYVKAGRNRKIWMVNALYLDKQRETNLIISQTWNGYAYEQIYGTAVVVNGGKVTINGGLIEGRGSSRGQENVSGGNDYTGDNFDYYHSLEPGRQVQNLISDSGRKAAVKIAKDGSTVIINDGEFWGNGGADVIGVYASDYKLEIHAGTFDTSKTDKERIPDHVAANHGKGPWGYLDLSYYTWYDCRAIRDTKRGDIGFGGKDGQGNDVVDLSKSRVFVDDEDDEVTNVADMNEFKNKSDHDTIIIQPKKKDTFFSDRENAFGQKVFAIYATDARVKNVIGSNFEGGNETLRYDRDQGTLLWYTVESMYDLTDKDNFYLKQMSDVNCTWTLYEVTLNADNTVKSIGATWATTTPALSYVKDGKLLYVFRCELDNWQRTARSSYQWKQDPKVRYYMTASATETFATSKHTLTTQMDNSDEFNYGTEREYAGGLRIEYQVSFQNNLNHPEFAVEYANARYGDAPKITLSDELQTLKSQKSACFLYQWQILRNGVWEDYGNWRISPDEAALILNNHYDLLGETLRLKVTEYDNKIKGALYSKERVVTKGGSVGDDPITPAINVTEDTVHAGKYVFQIDVNSDAQEFLVVPDDGAISPSRRISFLDWSGATTSKVIDNLDYGAYVVYTRYAATATTEAGKKVAYCSAYAKVIKATEDVQISYVTRANSYTSTRNQPVLSSGDDFATYVDGGTRYFVVESVPYGANDEVNKNTQWSCSSTDVIQPMKLERSGSSFVFVECEWGADTKGNTFAFKGIKAGKAELHAVTTLLDGTEKDTVINVYVMPDAATPHKMTTTAEGEIVKLMPGQTYEPQLVVSPDTVQPNSSNLRWIRKNTTSATPGVVVNTNTGVVTVKDDAQIGEIATIRGQYVIGSGISPLTFEYQVEVIASDEVSAHAHPGEDHTFTTFRQYDASQHLQICACGETAFAAHEFHDVVIRQATNEETGVLRHVCKDCGYSYQEDIPVGVHVHELYWDYDEMDHWQNCEADECSEDNYETNRGMHDFVLSEISEDGQEIYVCTVCGLIRSKDSLTLKFIHNIEFNNNIGMHYAIKKSELEGYSDLKLVINKEHYDKKAATPTTQRYELKNPATLVIAGEEYWHFTFPGICAPEMGNKIEATLTCTKDGVSYASQTDVYSVMDYAYNRLENSTKDSYKKLLVDMLNYGAAAQYHFEINADHLVNADLTVDQQKLASSWTDAILSQQVEHVTELTGATASFNGKNLSFDNKVVLLYGLNFTKFLEGVSSDQTAEKMANVKVKFTYDNGKEQKTQTIPYSKFQPAGDRLAAYCDVIAPAEMGCIVSATIYDGETPISNTIQYSIEAYAKDRLENNSTRESYKDLMRKMVLYGRAAKAHFG